MARRTMVAVNGMRTDRSYFASKADMVFSYNEKGTSTVSVPGTKIVYSTKSQISNIHVMYKDGAWWAFALRHKGIKSARYKLIVTNPPKTKAEK